LSESSGICKDGAVYESTPDHVKTDRGRREDVGTYPPPTIDIADAFESMIPECASTIGRANPVTTMREVKKRPVSIGPPAVFSYDANSSEPQCEKSAFGSGARTNVNADILS
jgi:hypothetical protein